VAVARSRRYRLAEADLPESIAEIDRLRIYEAFHYTHLTPYCVKELGLSEEVAACFIRVVRKGREVPELQEAVQVGRISVTKAKAIAAVITPENQEAWIAKATGMSKRDLEAEVAEANPRAGKPERARPVGDSSSRTKKWIQLHHKIARSEGGADTAKNLITLCSAHHRQWHKLRESSKG
jgi:hypothetical protein